MTYPIYDLSYNKLFSNVCQEATYGLNAKEGRLTVYPLCIYAW